MGWVPIFVSCGVLCCPLDLDATAPRRGAFHPPTLPVASVEVGVAVVEFLELEGVQTWLSEAATCIASESHCRKGKKNIISGFGWEISRGRRKFKLLVLHSTLALNFSELWFFGFRQSFS